MTRTETQTRLNGSRPTNNTLLLHASARGALQQLELSRGRQGTDFCIRGDNLGYEESKPAVIEQVRSGETVVVGKLWSAPSIYCDDCVDITFEPAEGRPLTQALKEAFVLSQPNVIKKLKREGVDPLEDSHFMLRGTCGPDGSQRDFRLEVHFPALYPGMFLELLSQSQWSG